MKKMNYGAFLLSMCCITHQAMARIDFSPFEYSVHVKDIVGKSPKELTQSRLLPNQLFNNDTPENSIPADISFMIIDIKYTDDHQVKILEYGDGGVSGFKVLDHTLGIGRVWEDFWYYLKQFKLPMWYAGYYNGRLPYIGARVLQNLGGHLSPSLKHIKSNIFFKAVARQRFSSESNQKIYGYKGIIVTRERDTQAIEKFKKNYPQFLVVNTAAKNFVTNKKATDDLFDEPELGNYRPKRVIYPKIYTPTLAENIINQLGSKYYVVKPINSGKGNGILMIKARDLDATLKLILEEYKPEKVSTTYSYNPYVPLTTGYWRHDRNPHFLVEEYVKSKPITVGYKPYDATMRIIFTQHYHEGKIYTKFINAYWKRPVKSLIESGTFREKHISKHAPNHYESLGLQVNVKDLSDIYTILKPVLPHVYWKMLTKYYGSKMAQEKEKTISDLETEYQKEILASDDIS
ncbi:hypothetical protein K2X40_03470 [Candidatus Babeliales bacterium]|nr:hypothetical protein [Candidatus Babeliales bacterium]